ncbi:MAG: DNA polymerase I [Peptococcaceae bacterium]|nr:DNA polymerase I [Peptococcaceae bacterium]MDH7526339.1 DNA polymerase I [Peptococcaceae bacterium]
MLIDGNSLAHRAFYAVPMLSNSKGFITNAIYGFCNMLFKIVEEEKPEYVAVAFDKGKIVFRHQDYGDYKAQRKATPDELRPQFPVLKELLRAMRIAVFECEGYEADDIIGTLARRGEDEGLQVVIVTGDRDALQLVSPRTKVVLTKKGISELETFDEETLKKKYGLLPEQMIDLKGLMGDSSDNIPGIPGVGEKTALKLIQEYGSMENVLAHHGDFKGKKLGELLRDYADQARLSRKLAVIEREVPVEFKLDDCKRVEPDYPKLVEILRELEFRSILENMMNKNNSPDVAGMRVERPALEGRVIGEPETLAAYLAENREGFSLYLRAKKERPAFVEITELGLKARGKPPGAVFPVRLSWKSPKELQALAAVLKPHLEREDLKKTVHDAKTALLACRALGIELRGVEYDTMLMAYLLNPSRAQTDLGSLSGDYLGEGAFQRDGGEEVYLFLEALELLGPRLKEELIEMKMWELYRDVELPLSRVLAGMEQRGVLLDRGILREMGKELEGRISRLAGEIHTDAGEEFNINSPKQLGEVLFGKLGLARGKKTKTGYSTSAEVLEALAPEHEIVAKILHYRQLVKIKTTYIDGLESLVEPVTGKVHTSFNQTVTATGRLSSTEPNLQNIPIRMEEGRRLRKAFLPSPGNRLLSADYSQIELRVLAHIAGDEVLAEAFHKGQDIHTRTAAEVFGVPMEAVTRGMRRAAKAVNFGIVYGISDFGLSQDLGISRAEAKEYIENYLKRYRGVKRYMERVVEEAREKGYVTTILNRRRYIPDILSRNFTLRSFAERTAMNTPVQGSAADIIKLAMLKLQEVLDKEEKETAMILQVHDELILDVPAGDVARIAQKVRGVMANAFPLSVPLKVDLQAGSNWYDLESIGSD